jgi:Domain of unknown function (DUF4340)
MSRRGLIILVGAFVVLVVLAVIGQRGGDGVPVQGAELVPGLEAAINDVERITLTKSGGETIATLERRPDGWVVTEKNAYRADVAKLRQGIAALAEARILEQKTANPESYARLGVEDVSAADAAGVAIALIGGGREWPTVILGNVEGNKYRYARRSDDPQSYLVDRNPDLPRSAAQWVDTEIVNVLPERVQQVAITHPDGEVVSISKSERGATNFTVANVPEGRELLYPGVANVIGNSLRELKLEDVAPAEATDAAEQAVVEFRTFDGLVVTVRGAEANDEAWINLTASFSAEQAAQFTPAAAPVDDAEASVAESSSGASSEQSADNGAAPQDGASTADVAAEAERINGAVGGWRYKIAGYQYDQLTRRMSDLLQAPPE